jgi:polysaccharide export outer membrane protein
MKNLMSQNLEMCIGKYALKAIIGPVCNFLILFAVMAALSGCSSSGLFGSGSQYKKQAHAQSLATSQKSFRLSSGDILKISVFGDQDFSNQYEIDRLGYIAMPLIGEISAAGKTPGELQRHLEYRLSQGYLVNPRVSIEVISFRPFYILGEVNNPGSYPYQPSLDVFKAIALAGGMTPRAVKDEFIIMRGEGANKQKFIASEDTPVMPGDSIKVKERFF